MEFRIFFTISNNKNDTFSINETYLEFTHAFQLIKIRSNLFTFCKALCEHLRIHEIFKVDQNKSYFLHKYLKFSVKSYVVAIY